MTTDARPSDAPRDASERDMPPVHPGEMLLEEYLAPLGMSQSELARRLHVDKRRVNDIVRGRRAVTADTAMRLALLFGTTPGFWLNIQKKYDLDVAALEAGDDHQRIEPLPTR
jgi:addiction module HigA family antidote